ncbi:MAG: NAD(P)H-dependent oxidoreductase [Sphingobacteriales bacterium]|jgi:chromate reductase|nr:NAD(P)H-dependent oxidoreductase [Sphingobacteriales bacterium]
MRIEIISGSPRKESISVRVALALQKWLKETTKHEIGLIDCREFQLPPLQSVFKSVEMTPDEFKPLAERMFGANAFIWVSPEFNGSYSPAMKNLIDHFSKQLHKPVGLVAVSTGALGGMRCVQQMILLSAAMFCIASPQLMLVPKADQKFDIHGNLIDENFYNNIHNFVAEFLWLAEKIAKNC